MYQKYIQTNDDEKTKKHKEKKLRKKRFDVIFLGLISKRRRDKICSKIDSYMFRKLQKLTEKLKKSLEKTEFSFYIASL